MKYKGGKDTRNSFRRTNPWPMKANLLAVPTMCSLRLGWRIVAFPIDIRIPQTKLHKQSGGQTFLGFLAAVPTAAIIPFEVGGQQFSEFQHHTIYITAAYRRTSSLGIRTYIGSKSLARFCCEFPNLQRLAESAFSRLSLQIRHKRDMEVRTQWGCNFAWMAPRASPKGRPGWGPFWLLSR
jgi:hypothetical protein